MQLTPEIRRHNSEAYLTLFAASLNGILRGSVKGTEALTPESAGQYAADIADKALIEFIDRTGNAPLTKQDAAEGGQLRLTLPPRSAS